MINENKPILEAIKPTFIVSYYSEKEAIPSPLIQSGVYRSWKVEADYPSYGPMPNNTEEKFDALELGCLGCGKGSSSNWFHAESGKFLASDKSTGCGGSLQLSDQARIKCERCGSISHMKKWSFSCSKHPGEYKAV